MNVNDAFRGDEASAENISNWVILERFHEQCFFFGRWRSRCHQRRHLEFSSSNDRPMSRESGLITSAVGDHLQGTCWENYFDPRGCCRSTGPTEGTNRFFSSADIPDDKSPTTHCAHFSWCLDMFGYVFNIVWGMGNKMDLSRAKCSGWHFAQTCHLHLILIAYDCVRIHHVISPSKFDIASCRQQLLSTGPKAVQISEIQDANRSLRMCFCYRTFLEIVHTCPHVLEEKSRWVCHWFVCVDFAGL